MCNLDQYTDVVTQWPPFCRQQFQNYFLEWKCRIMYFDFIFHFNLFPCVQSVVWHSWLNRWLRPNRRKAIISTNAGLFHWRIYASLGLNELKFPMANHWRRTVYKINHFVCAPSQWETTLQCNVVSHWLDACTNDPWYRVYTNYTCVMF